MYSIDTPVSALWRRLLLEVGRESGTDLQVIEHAPPAPLAELWQREDKAAVFMCGLPYSQAKFTAHILAAPVPSPADFHGRAEYWSHLVVRKNSHFLKIEDTYGRRMAFTAADSQSGFAAPLNFLRAHPGAFPRFGEIIAPQVTPLGALEAVINGSADVAPVDSYAFALLDRYRPELTAQVRTVARTESTPIPLLVSSLGSFAALQQAFLRAHQRPALQTLMQALLLERFVRPEPATYAKLSVVFEASLAFWRDHPLASIVHPAFL